MEVVLLVVAVIGIALIVVPRLKRSRKPRVRRTVSVKRRRRAAVAAASAPAAVATWTPPAGSSEDDSWDDDLGWEGVDAPASETREAWERWRETESPLASADDRSDEPLESPELPSVERWRAAASDDAEWLDDDDGLGWEGEADRAAGNGNGSGHIEPRVWVTPEPAPVTTGFVAAAATADDVATQPETGRVEGVDTDWKPAGREWGATETDASGAVAAPAAPRKLRIHPVLLVAIYAAAGIGLVVLVSTVLLGGNSSAPTEPAKQVAPAPTPAPASELVGSAADEPGDAEAEAGDAAAAAAQARRDFQREQTRAVGAERRAAAAKAEAARKAAAAKRKREQRQQQSGGGSSTVPPGGGGAVTRPPVYSPPPRSQPTCEFCIG